MERHTLFMNQKTILLRCHFFSQFIYIFNTIPIKIQAGICAEIHKFLLLQKIHENEKSHNYVYEKEFDTYKTFQIRPLELKQLIF